MQSLNLDYTNVHRYDKKAEDNGINALILISSHPLFFSLSEGQQHTSWSYTSQSLVLQWTDSMTWNATKNSHCGELGHAYVYSHCVKNLYV